MDKQQCDIGSETVARFLAGPGAAPSLSVSAGSAAGNRWDEFKVTIADEFRRSPTGFLRQPTIEGVIHPNAQALARAYFDELRADPFSLTEILPRLHDMPLGDPYLCSFFPFVSPLSMQHAYYLSMMKRCWGLFAPDGPMQHILEIGGGYGNFCRLMLEYGYTGRYVIADLPEMHWIQKYYLGRVLPRHAVDEQIIFRPLDSPDILPGEAGSLLVATFSVSEMPLATRQSIEDKYKQFDYVFISYTEAFDGIDNLGYFDSLAKSLRSDFNVRQIADSHRRAWFILCDRRSQQ